MMMIAFFVCLVGVGIWLVCDIERELRAPLREPQAEYQRRMDEEFEEACRRG
jgi:hypothetical protein